MKRIECTVNSIDGIRKAISRISKKIDAPKDLLPTYQSSIDGGHPHIELDTRGFHFVVVERGAELERRTTQDPHELLYWVFEGVTFSMACKYELENRVKGQDSRRLLFRKQIELLGQLDDEWRRREEQDHEKTLCEHPFDDDQ